jgi:hypothetical protein
LDTRGLSNVPGWQTGGQHDSHWYGPPAPPALPPAHPRAQLYLPRSQIEWQTRGQRDSNRFRQDVPSQSWGYASDGIYMPQEHRAPRPCMVLSTSLLYRSRRQLHELAVLDRRATGVAMSVGLGNPVAPLLSLQGPASRPSSPHLTSPHFSSPHLTVSWRRVTEASPLQTTVKASAHWLRRDIHRG